MTPQHHRVGPALAALSLLLLGSLLTSSALAQRGSELEHRLEEGMNAWDNLEIERAQSILDDAIQLADDVGSDEPVVAEIYLMRGIVEAAISGDEGAVVGFFTEGLLVDRQAELDPYYASPDLESLLEQARAALPPPPEPVNALTHTPEVTVRAGEPVPISAEVERSANVERVALYYKPFGATRYVAEYLDIETPIRFGGAIPGTATTEGIQLEYYLQALDPDGEIVGHSATPSAAHVVVILEGDGGPGAPSGDRIGAAAIGIGTGGGLATGEPIVMGGEVDLNPGIALTPLHVYADVTFRVTEILELGPFLRLQTVLLEDGVEIETLVGAKLKWFFANDNPLMYATVGGGYGYVRHTVDLSPTIDFVDTTREGPFHGGVGFGVAYLFTDHVGILTDLYAMVLFDEVSVQLDLNLGLYLAF